MVRWQGCDAFVEGVVMEADKAELEQWWNTLTEEQQDRLKKAARSYPA